MFVAQTESSRQVNIVARVSGFLDRIAYQEGELVKQGQLMFQLDPKPFQAQLNAARGELDSQQARLATAEVTYGRVKPLAEQDALPQTDLDRAKGELDAAKAAVFSAQAKVDEAKLNLGYATITSPSDGHCQSRAAAAGRVRELARRQCEPHLCRGARSDLGQLQHLAEPDGALQGAAGQGPDGAAQGRQLRCRARAARRCRSIRSAARSGSPIRRSARTPGSFLVRAVIPNPKSDLRPGMFVTARVIGALRPNAIVVPQLAVQQGSNGHLVYVVNAERSRRNPAGRRGRLLRRQRHRDSARALRKGDRVVVEGVLKVVPGQPVTVVAPGAAPAAEAPAAKRPAAKK